MKFNFPRSDGEEYSDSLDDGPPGTWQPRRKFDRWRLIGDAAMVEVADSGGERRDDDTGVQDDKHSTRGQMRKKWRLKKSSHPASSSSLHLRIQSLQRRVDSLLHAKEEATLSSRELQRTNQKMAAQLESLAEKVSSGKQMAQKLSSELAGAEQQKKVLEMEVEQWRQSTFPRRLAHCSCQALEVEVKQLQAKVKSTSAEVTRQVAANKDLRGQVRTKEEKLREVQDKASQGERDVSAKRQLLDDMKTRLKLALESEKSYRGQLEDLEKKVKCLSDEASNRKAFIESLKRRLNVATDEKNRHEASCTRLKDELEKKEHRIEALQARVGAGERASAALEQSAAEETERLTRQHSRALDGLQRRLGQASSQLEQLHSLIKAMAAELLTDLREVKRQLAKKRRLRRSAMAARGGPSAKSIGKAKSVAASILNMSENDLADIMDSDQGTEALSDLRQDQEWLDYLHQILQQKIPSAGQLMEALRAKLKERKVLTEELATLAAAAAEDAVSEKA
ncbi:centlein [Stigmatopora nigra]